MLATVHRRRRTCHSERSVVLIKALKLIQFLAARRFGATIQDMEEEIETSRRSVYRYLKAFDQAGIRMARTKCGRHGAWKIEKREQANQLAAIF